MGGTTNSITQNFLWVEEKNKQDQLVKLLHEVPGLTLGVKHIFLLIFIIFLVFVEMKKSADFLHAELYRLSIEFQCKGDYANIGRRI